MQTLLNLREIHLEWAVDQQGIQTSDNTEGKNGWSCHNACKGENVHDWKSYPHHHDLEHKCLIHCHD